MRQVAVGVRSIGGRNRTIRTVTTGDIEALVADLEVRDIDVDDEIRDTLRGRFAMVRDPDGNARQQ